VIALALLCAWFVFGRRITDEDQVRAVIDGVEAALEDRDTGGVLAHVAETFKGQDGLTKKQLRGVLAARFLGSRETISIQRSGETRVDLRGPVKDRRSATATFRARISDRGTIGAALEREAWDFEVDLAKDGSDWRITGYRMIAAP